MGKIKPYMYNPGDVIHTTKSAWTILGRKILSQEEGQGISRKAYLCQCHKCGSSVWKKETELFQGSNGKQGQGNCGVCFNRVVITGKNDVATTHPECVRFFRDPEDALHINAGSREKRWFKCPDCGYEWEKGVEYVTSKGRICCPNCSDTVSYPNKLARSVLKQLNVDDLVLEFHDTWSGNYRYDCSFYKNSIHYLLEMDGDQHFSKIFDRKGKDQQKIDAIKNQLAKENGCELIRIECRKSDLEYIKTRLLQSKLNSILDFSSVDWKRVESDCAKSILIEVAQYYLDHPIASLEQIGHAVGLCSHTVRTYLKRANTIGLINYKTMLEEMDENFNKVLEYKKEHMEASNVEIANVIGGITNGTVRNYLIKAKQKGLIDCINAAEYKRIKTKEYIQNHPDKTDIIIANDLSVSKDFITKMRGELMSSA